MSTTQSDTNSQDADSADVPYPLLLLQTTLAALLFVLVLGWVLLTTNAIFGSGSPTRLFWSLPAIFGVAALLLVVTYLNRFLSQ